MNFLEGVGRRFKRYAQFVEPGGTLLCGQETVTVQYSPYNQSSQDFTYCSFKIRFNLTLTHIPLFQVVFKIL